MKILLPLLFASLISHAQIETHWEKVGTTNGVEIYKGEIKDSSVVAFRGLSKIEAPIGKVLSVVYDVSRMKEWMSALESTRLLEKKSNFSKIEYNKTNAPWPLSDRDFVYSVDVKVIKADKAVDIRIENAVHPDAPPIEGIVRGELRSSRYFLKSQDNGQSTSIEVEILVDPKGSIPKWVVNMFQREWPSSTVNGIRKIATGPDYQIHPDITASMKDFHFF